MLIAPGAVAISAATVCLLLNSWTHREPCGLGDLVLYTGTYQYTVTPWPDTGGVGLAHGVMLICRVAPMDQLHMPAWHWSQPAPFVQSTELERLSTTVSVYFVCLRHAMLCCALL